MRAILLLVVFATTAHAQTLNAVPMPTPEVQWLDSTGAPLAGGKLCTYVANTTTPLATYTDASANTANSNPVVLDSAGRASIWVGFQLYKFVLRSGGDNTCTTGTILWTQDNVGVVGAGLLHAINITQSGTGASGKGGYIDIAPIDYPNLTCFDKYGNPVNQPTAENGFPAFGANDVVMWNSLSPLAGVSPPGCATAFTPNLTYGLNFNTYLFAMGGYASDLTSYNTFDALSGGMHALSFSANNYVNTGHHAGVPTLTTNDSFNAGATYFDDTDSCQKVYNGSVWSCIGSGGGGTPGGSDTQVQYNAAGVFGGSANFTWDNANRLLTVTPADSAHAGIAVANGFVQAAAGFVVPAATAYNVIQAPLGGMAARSFTATKYVQTGNGTTDPTVSTSDTFNAGALYYNTSGSPCLKVYDGAAWNCVTGVTGANTALSNLASVSINTALLFQTGTDIGSTVKPARDLYLFGGGTYGTNYFHFTGTPTGHRDLTLPDRTANVATSSGALTNGHCVSIDGSGNFVDAGGACTTGGGGGTVSSGTATQVAYYTATGTTVGGAGSMLWDNANQLLSVTALNASSAGIAVATGFIQSAKGFVAVGGTATNYNTIQAPGGGAAALSFTAANYLQTGNHSGIPTVTTGDSFNAGAMFWDTAAGCEKVYNGSGWSCLSSGSGVSSLNSLTGALTLVQTANQVLITPSGSTLIFSTPQSIATTSAVTFGSVTTGSGGAFNSGATGASIAFQTTNTNFQVDGNGNISGAGSLNLTGGSSSYKMGGSVIVDVSRNATFNNLTVGGTCTGCTPQALTTSSSPTFNNLTSNGTVTVASNINSLAGSYETASSVVINTAGAFIGGGGVNVGSAGISGGNYNLNGGFIGQTYTVTFSGGISISGVPSCTSGLIYRGGIVVSCF